ncbi:AAA family ATPase [Paenibacillus sp. Y5S-9]|uniref:AAA family ATPase n=1 Tax=Paenibacillus sp. Y5S-9 TaxID=3122489 RepID=UPI0030D12EED
MGKSLIEVAQQLKDNDKKVQLIYAFNGTGKTRLSGEFKLLFAPKVDDDTELEESEVIGKKILYYNAFTEDLFYWDNDLEFDVEPKLKIHPNAFTKWIFEEQGQDFNVISNFQHYTDEKLSPRFNEESFKNEDGNNVTVRAFTEITFSYERGNDDRSDNIKISKGEESSFIWCVFYSLLEQVIEVLNVAEPTDRGTDQFDQLEYVFIDDPVSSLDDNHLIELAVNLAKLIKSSALTDLKFIITTHNPLFYNVLFNEFRNTDRSTGYNSNKHFKWYKLEKKEEGTYELVDRLKDSPFSYHLFLINEIEKAIEADQVYKYHFNFIRNILEKTATFLGYSDWAELLLPVKGNRDAYVKRILNLSSHSKHSAEEIVELTNDDKNVIRYLMNEINEIYRFKKFIKGGNE